MIKVVNKHSHSPTPQDVYIGRGSALGNPYTSIKGRETKAKFVCESREESVNNYYCWLREKIDSKDAAVCAELNRIYKLAQKGHVNLICFCAPKLCHGDVIKEIVESKIKKS